MPFRTYISQKIILAGLTALVITLSAPDKLEAANGKYRLGIQGTHFISGISGVMEISDPWALQGVLDFTADALGFRVLNRFHREPFWNAYGEGTLAVRSHSHVNRWGRWDHNGQHSDVGLGIGVGVEYDWRGLNPSLPPIGINIELGANLVPGIDLGIGLGVHWIFR